MHTMVRFAFYFALLSIVGLATSCNGCQDACADSPQNCVKVPATDSTPPGIALSAFIDDLTPPDTNPAPVTDTSPAVSQTVAKGKTLVLWGTCTDNDGGCKDVRVWFQVTKWTTNADGTVTLQNPGLLGAPAAEQKRTAAVGDTVTKQLITTFKVQDFQNLSANTRIQIDAWADGTNFSGGTAKTNVLTLKSP